VDIFANKANAESESELEQLEELMHKFRRTPQTVLLMPSTPYATIRVFLEADKTDTLMRMVDDRFNYGIFPDDASLAMMLDHFLTRENWRDAAKTAIAMTLQEEDVVPISSEMALYGLYKYAMLAEKTEPWEPQASPPEEDPEDEVKIRLKWADTEYNDDHFDLNKESHLVGKSLEYIARKSQEQGAAERALRLLGCAMFEKWDEMMKLMEEGKGDTLAKCCVERTKKVLAAAEKCENKDEILSRLDGLKVEDVDVDAQLKKRIESSVAAKEPDFVKSLEEKMKKWNAAREDELERQYQILQIEARKGEVLRTKKEMAEKEEKMFFFEREQEYERTKESSKLRWRKTLPKYNWKGRITLKPKETVSDDYVPPTVR
jgi:small subunit ribosomal protein S27